MTPAIMFELASITQHNTAVQEQWCRGRPLRVAKLPGESGVLIGGMEEHMPGVTSRTPRYGLGSESADI
jgi:hypothetical protein